MVSAGLVPSGGPRGESVSWPCWGFPVAYVIDLPDVLGSSSQRESLGTERVSMLHEEWVVELEVNPTHHIPVGSVAIRRSLKM